MTNLPTPDYNLFNTDEEIIVETAAFLIYQGERSNSSDLKCLYRGPNGFKCAVGYWIPDEDYVPSMEMNGIVNMLPILEISGKSKPEFIKFLKDHVEILNLLQKVHDSMSLGGFSSADRKTVIYPGGLESLFKALKPRILARYEEMVQLYKNPNPNLEPGYWFIVGD